MDMFVLGAVAVLAAMAGFWAGRSLRWQFVGAEGEAAAEHTTLPEKAERRGAFRLSACREIGSPVEGEMSVMEEYGKKKIRIYPAQGRVYAPVSGKIAQLYPMGRAIKLRTEFGADILLNIGDGVDEMCSEFYRCRVMEHEVIRKGALLLEYDPECIDKAGGNPEVVVSVENEEALEIVAAPSKGFVKVGAPILYVSCDTRLESYEKRI